MNVNHYRNRTIYNGGLDLHEFRWVVFPVFVGKEAAQKIHLNGWIGRKWQILQWFDFADLLGNSKPQKIQLCTDMGLLSSIPFCFFEITLRSSM